MFLGTCNRVEVIYAREEGEPPGTDDVAVLVAHLGGALDAAAPSPWTLRTGRDAVRHLFRVSASLDSLVVGEDQILAQVREAYGRAADLGLTGPLLGPLFHHALAVGKQVRSETDLSRHRVSVVSLAVAEMARRADATAGVRAVIGAGDMGSLLARVLCDAGLPPRYIVNRRPERAAALATECGAQVVSLQAFLAGEAPVDVLLSATAAPGLVLDGAALRRLAAATPGGGPLLTLDLAVPRDIAPLDDPRVQRIDLDDLRAAAEANKALRLEAAGAAEQLVDRKVETLARRFGESAAAPEVTELRQAAADILDKELAGLLGGRLAHLDESDRRAVERWARATFGRVMHLPVAALKRLAGELVERGEVEGDDAAPRDADETPAGAPAGTRGDGGGS